MYTSARIAVADIASAISRYPLAGMLGWQDVKQRYRRSSIGPFWLTISMGIMITTIGLVFGKLFRSPISEFLPFLAIGVILWAFISAVVTEGCLGFVSAEAIIKQLPIPLFVHMLRMTWRNLIVLAHNLFILPLVYLFFLKPISWVALLSLPGLAVLTLNLSWLALILGVVCTRYRDLPQIVNSILQVAYFVTPIMWLPNLLPGRASLYLLDMNPLYHLIEIVRAPLLGAAPTLMNWCASLGLALVGWLVALALYGRYRNRIAYWL